MRRFKEKLNKKGFTLAELLIVVAIIAVLVAVSVPVFNSKLERSREAVDIANMRAAKVAAAAAYLNDEIDNNKKIYYDAEAGTIINDGSKPESGYGQGTSVDGKTKYLKYESDKSVKGDVIEITITPESDNKDVEISMKWVSLTGTSDPD